MMKRVHRMRGSVAYTSALWLALGGFATAQETVEAVLVQLKAVQKNEDASVEELREAVVNVQRIVDDFPASDAAVSILLMEQYDGIDFSSFETRIALVNKPSKTLNGGDTAAASVDQKAACVARNFTALSRSELRLKLLVGEGGNIEGLPELINPKHPTSEERKDYLGLVAALEDCTPFESLLFGGEFAVITSSGSSVVFESLSNDSSAEPAVVKQKVPVIPQGGNSPIKFAKSSVATEKSLNLGRQAIRDVQARLLVIGHDPNGVDGIIGSGTRNAVRAWQISAGLAATGFLSEAQLAFLKEQSQVMLDDWLKIRNNANLYSPPKRSNPTSSKPVQSKNSGWYRDSRGMYCKRGNFWTRCTSYKPKALR